ncbi:hypothetical protein D3C77_316330 [compost metagenome]
MDRSVASEQFVLARQTLAGSSAWTRAEAMLGTARVWDRDPDDMTVSDDEAQGDAALVYHLTYTDSQQRESLRIVTVRRIDALRDGLKLFCWCHAASANRQFRVDRIREVFCVATGEVFDSPETYFAAHPMLVSPRDPEAYALATCRHEVNVLTILAAADGEVHEDE